MTMETDTSQRMSFEQYQRLSPDQKEFFTFDKLCKIDDVCKRLDDLENKFAAKWVQNVMTWLAYILGGSVVTALLALVIGNKH